MDEARSQSCSAMSSSAAPDRLDRFIFSTSADHACIDRVAIASLILCVFCLIPPVDRRRDGEQEQNRENGKTPAGRSHLLIDLTPLPLNLGLHFAGNTGVTARLDDRYENIMRKFHPACIVAILIGEEPAVDQFIENGLSDILAGERIIEGATVTISSRREKLVLDKGSHAHGKVLNGPEVEVPQKFSAVRRRGDRG